MSRIEQLVQIFNGATWDGDLIGKSIRDELVKAGLVERTKHGYNIITAKGVEYAVEMGLSSQSTSPLASFSTRPTLGIEANFEKIFARSGDIKPTRTVS